MGGTELLHQAVAAPCPDSVITKLAAGVQPSTSPSSSSCSEDGESVHHDERFHDPMTNAEESLDTNAKAAQARIKGRRRPYGSSGKTSQCVWVGNVCPSVSEQQFRELFEPFGSILLLRMFSKSKCAFVTYDTPASALKCLCLEGILVGSMRLTLNVGLVSRHLWIGNLNPNMTEQVLRSEFSAFGIIDSIRLFRENRCAFVNFTEDRSATKALEALNGKDVSEYKMVINYQWKDTFKKHLPPRKHSGAGLVPVHDSGTAAHAVPDKQNARHESMPKPQSMPAPQPQPRGVNAVPQTTNTQPQLKTPSPTSPALAKLFVGNLAPSVTEASLWQLFSHFGEIKQIKDYILQRGYAFVVFNTMGEASWARDALTLYPVAIDGRQIVVNFGRVQGQEAQQHPEKAILAFSARQPAASTPYSTHVAYSSAVFPLSGTYSTSSSPYPLYQLSADSFYPASHSQYSPALYSHLPACSPLSTTTPIYVPSLSFCSPYITNTKDMTSGFTRSKSTCVRGGERYNAKREAGRAAPGMSAVHVAPVQPPRFQKNSTGSDKTTHSHEEQSRQSKEEDSNVNKAENQECKHEEAVEGQAEDSKRE